PKQPARATAPAPAARTESKTNRAAPSAPKETPRPRVEAAPRVERRNDNNPPAIGRSSPPANPGHGSSKRDTAPRDNRVGNDSGAAKVIGGGQVTAPRSSQNLRPDRGQVNSPPQGQPNVRVDRRERNPQGNVNPQPK